MTRCLRVRVGQSAYLVPSESVGAVAVVAADRDDSQHRRRVFDARRIATGRDGAIAGAGTSGPSTSAVAVEWIGAHGRVGGVILVDEVEGLVEVDAAEITMIPDPARSLRVLFDGFWYDATRSTFLLRLRTAKRTSFAQLRELLLTLAPLRVSGRGP